MDCSNQFTTQKKIFSEHCNSVALASSCFLAFWMLSTIFSYSCSDMKCSLRSLLCFVIALEAEPCCINLYFSTSDPDRAACRLTRIVNQCTVIESLLDVSSLDKNRNLQT